MIKRENFKNTVFALSNDKEIKKDIDEILQLAKEKKSEPFHVVYIIIPKTTRPDYVEFLLKNLPIKRQSSDKKFLMLEL